MKNHGIPMQQKLLDKLAKDRHTARKQSDDNNGELLEMRADEYVKLQFTNI